MVLTSASLLLKKKFAERKAKNPRYSLRAFARDLELSPSHLSLVMNGKRGLSLRSASGIADAFRLEGEEREEFVSQSAQNPEPLSTLLSTTASSPSRFPEPEGFRLIIRVPSPAALSRIETALKEKLAVLTEAYRSVRPKTRSYYLGFDLRVRTEEIQEQ